MAQLTGQPALEIFPKGKDVFFWKVVKAVHRQGAATLDAPRTADGRTA
ncbi:MAG TPA: hypothetical protein VE359_00935 [Vicinamibacteria bacterium]|nr:hypothetical protein [Vicinamibacteria bacterium]